MKKGNKKLKIPVVYHGTRKPKPGSKLSPERKKILREGVKETIRKYGSVLKKLGKT